MLGMDLQYSQVEIMGGRDVDAFAEIEVAGQKESDIPCGGGPMGLWILCLCLMDVNGI